MTESERAYHEYGREKRRKSLQKWQLNPNPSDDDDEFSDDEEEEETEELGDAKVDVNSSLLKPAPAVASSVLPSTADASRMMERQIESRENIIHLLLGGDEREPPLRQTLSASSFTAAVRPFTANSVISRGKTTVCSPSSPTSVSVSSSLGVMSLVDAKRQLVASAQLQRTPVATQSAKVINPKVQNAWHCDDGSDDEFDKSLRKSMFQTLSLFQHRPANSLVLSGVNDDQLVEQSAPTQKYFRRPMSAPLRGPLQQSGRSSPVELARANAVSSPTFNHSLSSGKLSLQALLAQQARDLSALEDKRQRYDTETASYLSRQRSLHDVLGAVAHGAWS